ncbi:MAG: hypothetical protein ACXW3Z_10015 [Limisphaerales bacterium]
MLERLNPILRLVCIALAGLMLFQLARLVQRGKAVAQIQGAGATAVGTNVTVQTNRPSAVPPEIAARIDKIKDTQVLGQIMRPPPMALMGIAGPDVLMRGPNGQMGMIRVGEQLEGVKLISIGVNRVLVEHDGQQKELMLFEGFGGESLLSKGKENK